MLLAPKIYNEEVRDLLATGGSGDKRDKLELKEDSNKGVYVKVSTVFSLSRDTVAHTKRKALDFSWSCLGMRA